MKQVVDTIHEVTVPDDLLAWGRDMAVCRGWARPWAHEVDGLLERGSKGPLDARRSKALYARLEALCAEAVGAGQGELLLGFDTYSAAKLGLRFTFPREGDAAPIVFAARGGSLRFVELETLIGAGATRDQAIFAEECNALMRGVFPRSRFDAMMSPDEASACAGCGTGDHAVMLTMESGSEYCSPCWQGLVADWPSRDELLGKSKAQKKNRRRR